MKKITISGEIGSDVRPDDVRSQLVAAHGDDIDIHIASPGGYVSDGIEIYNMIRDYKRENPGIQIMATLKGYAMSIASYLAVNPAIDMVVAEDNAVFMIHNVWGATVGDYREMRKSAEIFEGLTGVIAKAYVGKTKKDYGTIREMMDAETWLFGDEIKAAGFVDDMIPSEEKTDKAAALAVAREKYKNVLQKNEPFARVEKAAAMVRLEAHNPAENAGKNTQEGKTMTLQELLSQNPAAKIEYDNALNERFQAGKSEGEKSTREALAAAGKYLGPDAAYPAPIKSLAVDVLNGKKSVEALETTVAAFDALKESKKSDDAKNETDEKGETPGQQPPALSTDGVIRSAEDYKYAIARAHGEV